MDHLSDARDRAFSTEYRRIEAARRARASRAAARPDRFALWALGLAVIAMLAGVASSAHGSSGALAPVGDDEEKSGCVNVKFGKRVLDEGDCGDDVRTLNWMLRSKPFAKGVKLAQAYERPTTRSIRKFERKQGQPVNGRVEKATRKALVKSLPRQIATWYGPGFWGNTTACGKVLRRKTIGVAHKRLPCGTKVVIGYGGRFVRATVIDRGPYANNARWDLTQATAKRIKFTGTAPVRVAVVKR